MTEPALAPDILELFRRLGVALAIGLLIGVERGWKDREEPAGSRTAGIRTFALIGLLGGVAAALSMEAGGIVLALGLLAFALVMGGFELLHARRYETSDATPFVAALATFALGALAGLGNLEAAAAASVAVAIVLTFKEELHGWLTKVTFAELQAGLVLAAMTMIVLPLLPSEPVDPWGAVSLRAIWLLTVLIAAVSFVGYAAIRIIGPERGALVAGLAGGLVSSTATVASFARMAKEREDAAPALIAGAVAANTVMFARVGLVAGALRSDLIPPLVAALGPATLASAAMALFLARRTRAPEGAGEAGAGEVLKIENPLALRAALMFGGLLAVVSILAAALEGWLGPAGVYVLAAVSGIGDADAIMLSMTQAHAIPAEVAALAVLIAAAVNTAVKAALGAVAGGARVGWVLVLTSAIALALGLLGYLALRMA